MVPPKWGGEPMAEATFATDARTYRGGCHCGAVRVEVDFDLDQPVSRCNYSLCTKLATANAIVKPSAFRLLSGEESLTNTVDPAIDHPFCRRCGVHAFGRGNLPELGGEYCAVNVNCLDDVEVTRLTYQYWDGRHDNWDAGPRGEPWPIGT
jgi:hypothetical protein